MKRARFAADAFELTVTMPDGTERVERFADQTAWADREAALRHNLESEGWTGPHGWNL
jgi:hypothetical protein